MFDIKAVFKLTYKFRTYADNLYMKQNKKKYHHMKQTGGAACHLLFFVLRTSSIDAAFFVSISLYFKDIVSMAKLLLFLTYH